MAKRRVVFAPGCFYHVFNRGIQRLPIFNEKENYLYLIRLLTESVQKSDVSVIAFCLMPNHYHFLLKQNSNTSISACIQQIFNAYTKAFNNRYGRMGPLFEGPFKAVLVDDEGSLLHLCRYIHRNPVDCDPPIVNNPLEWSFSNLPEWIGKKESLLFDPEFVQEYFPNESQYLAFLGDAPSLKVVQRMERLVFE